MESLPLHTSRAVRLLQGADHTAAPSPALHANEVSKYEAIPIAHCNVTAWDLSLTMLPTTPIHSGPIFVTLPWANFWAVMHYLRTLTLPPKQRKLSNARKKALRHYLHLISILSPSLPYVQQ